MRTTIRVDDDLYRRAKATAARQGRSVGELIEDAIRMALRPRGRAAGDIADLPVHGGSGTMPGVDLGDPRGLRAVMDEGAGLDEMR